MWFENNDELINTIYEIGVAQGLHRSYKLKHKQDDDLHHPVCVSV